MPSGRRRWLVRTIGLAAAAAVFAIVFVAASGANLTGSSFEGNDGNLVVNTAGNTDWDNAPNLHVGVDKPTGQTDNAFGQGTSENDVNVTVVTGSIPNSKADLARFAVASEFVNGSNFLYLAWTRENLSGTVNFDFEVNQKTQPDLTTPGPKTLVRTAGDLLINYSFQGGANTPTLTLRKWTGSAWGAEQTLNSTSSEGATNSATVVDTLGGNPPVNRPPQAFGEAAINLTTAGVFPPGTCEAFGSAFVKSRSSTSFTSEIKDLIAPVPVNISNCGTINIIKHSDPRGQNQNFNYTSTIPASPSACSLDTTPASFTLNDTAGVDPSSPITTGTANTEHCSNVPAGTYTVTEGPDPANFVFESLACSADNGGSFSTSGKVATITVAPNSTVTCIYTNQLQTGAIKVTKTRKHAAGGPGDHPHAGVTFTVNGVSKQTDANGVACFDGLLFGTYTVHETVPTGYHVDANDKQVTVDNTATCSDNPYGGESVSFHNTPLTNITASVDSQVDGGTQSTITCVNSANNTVASGSSGANGDGSASASDLEPDTYTCTIVIDP